jgi:hypothetical protein
MKLGNRCIKKTALFLACCLWWLPAAAHADVAAVLKGFDGPQPNRRLMMMLVIGTEEGFDTVNGELKEVGGAPLYCSPAKLRASN